jgi:hypothetical protein
MSLPTPPAITTQLAHADPGASPLTLNELIDILNPLFSSELDGTYVPQIIIQAATPGTDKAGYVWLETDSAGRPLSIRTYYNGHWRRVYNGMIGEIRMYSGDPADDAIWDSNGHGKVGGTYDGWQICNGKNSSPDLSDQFVVGASMNGDHPQYSNGWQTFVDGKTSKKTGGSKDHMIVSNELPPINPDDPDGPRSDLVLRGNEFSSGDPGFISPRGVQAIVSIHNTGIENQVTIAHYGANPSGHPEDPQVAMPVIPPFYCLAFIVFQGYTT